MVTNSVKALEMVHGKKKFKKKKKEQILKSRKHLH